MTRRARIEIRPVHPNSVLGEGRSPALRPHYLVLIAANGETLATSETYANRQNARRGVKAWLEAMSVVTEGVVSDYRAVEVQP